MSKCLIKFNEYGPGMGFPSMKASFENAPYSGIDKIIAYLENGKKTYAATSKARDFFTGDIIQEENCGMTDGEFSWNGSLIYYVKKYNLRLLKEFEDYVLATKIDMKRIKDAKYFINKVIKENHSKDEWRSLRDEKKWLKDAPTDQKDEFLSSGAAECLAMICVRL